MVEKFDSKFHKEYVGGEGEVIEREFADWRGLAIRMMTFEDVLAEYQKYVGNSEAKMPESLVEELRLQGKVAKK